MAMDLSQSDFGMYHKTIAVVETRGEVLDQSGLAHCT
jgi:hypothetical protein